MFENKITSTKKEAKSNSTFENKKIAYRQFSESKKEMSEAQKAELERRLLNKRVRPKFEINHDYAEKQAAKHQNDVVEIKEVNESSAAEQLFKDKIKAVLEMSDIIPDSEIILEMLKENKKKYGEVMYNDLKNHEIIKAYYQLESLHKYMAKQNKPN